MVRKGDMSRKTQKPPEGQRRSSTFGRGVQDRGPLEFKARAPEQDSEVLRIARTNVVTIPPTMTIMGAVKTLISYKLRRVPVCDPGTLRLDGICSVMDVIDFLGGGDKHLLITRKHKGRFVVAVNDDVREIMQMNVVTVPHTASMLQALRVLQQKGQGGAPVVDDEYRVVGTVAEVNFVEQMVGRAIGATVKEAMSTRITTAPPQTSIRQVAETMVRDGYRRIPVVKDGVLIGITSASDILRYLGSGEMFELLVTGDIDEAVSRPIRTIMKTSLVTISPRADVGDAASVMMDRWIGSIPVVENDRLVGVLTQTDVLRYYPGLGT